MSVARTQRDSRGLSLQRDRAKDATRRDVASRLRRCFDRSRCLEDSRPIVGLRGRSYRPWAARTTFADRLTVGHCSCTEARRSENAGHGRVTWPENADAFRNPSVSILPQIRRKTARQSLCLLATGRKGGRRHVHADRARRARVRCHTRGVTFSTSAGVAYPIGDRLVIAADGFYTPLTVKRTAASPRAIDPLINARVLLTCWVRR